MNFRTLKLDALIASDVNPRLMDGAEVVDGLAELAESIKAHGILQPLLVSPAKGGAYRIVAGHRRAAAAVIAGLQEVPCIVDQVKHIEQAHLVENVQRVDLSPAEIALAVTAALKAKRIKAKQLAAELGKSETWVSKAHTIGKALATPELVEWAATFTSADELYEAVLRLTDKKRKTQERPARQAEQLPEDLEKLFELWLARTWSAPAYQGENAIA